MKSLILDPDRPLWFQMPNESDDQYQKFQTFLEVGRSRSLMQVARHWRETGASQGGSRSQDVPMNYRWIREVCAANHWIARAHAFDMEEDAHKFQLMREASEAATKADLENINEARGIVATELAKIVATLKSGGTLGVKFDRLIDAQGRTTRSGRLLVGDVTVRVAVETPDMARQRRLNNCVAIIVESLSEYRVEHRDASTEEFEAVTDRLINWSIAPQYFGEFTAAEIRNALRGNVDSIPDQTSDANN